MATSHRLPKRRMRLPKRGTRCIVPARLGVVIVAILYCATWTPATGDEPRRRIYFLESLAPTQPAAIRTIEAFKRRLDEKTIESFDIYRRWLDDARRDLEPYRERYEIRYLVDLAYNGRGSRFEIVLPTANFAVSPVSEARVS